MIDKIEFKSENGELLVLEQRKVNDGIIIADIGGLGPVKATMVSSSFANLDGEQYQSMRREARDMKFRFELRPDFTSGTIRQIRQRLYRFFMTKTQVDMGIFLDDGLVVDILGKVETCEPTIFTKEPAMDVGIRCHLPDFVEPGSTVFPGASGSDYTIDYEGTVEAGVIFRLYVNQNLSNFTIYHRSPAGEMRQMDFSYAAGLVDGDIVEISTITGNKYARLKRGSAVSEIVYTVSPYSYWFELFSGNNTIRVFHTGGPIPFEIEYVTRHGGL